MQKPIVILVILSLLLQLSCKHKRESDSIFLEKIVPTALNDCLNGGIGYFIPVPLDTLGNVKSIDTFHVLMDTTYSTKYTGESLEIVEQSLLDKYEIDKTLSVNVVPMSVLPGNVDFEKDIRTEILDYDTLDGDLIEWVPATLGKKRNTGVFAFAKPIVLEKSGKRFIALPVIFVFTPRTVFQVVYVFDAEQQSLIVDKIHL